MNPASSKLGHILAMSRGSILPLATLLLVVFLVLPVPALVLDIGFIFNIMISLAVLMVALNVTKPLDFSSFPTVLLFATLLRLGLNVASTRVVLVHGHEGGAAAGHVIEAFGSLLIGGDYVVGIFVFAILMIINLVVITKGAGRVSEVSARFTLDAMPGKQMAIDADLNAGLMTPEEAKARRAEVATEADFYGSMDGASKFVKGDAVAGVLILVVNIVGGIILGMASHGLGIAEAASNYTMLAIGDALVAQVPALLLSIAAASIVTRVNSAQDLPGQISGQFAIAKRGRRSRRSWASWACCPACRTSSSCLQPLPPGISRGSCRVPSRRWSRLSPRQRPKTPMPSNGKTCPMARCWGSMSASGWCRWSTSAATRR